MSFKFFKQNHAPDYSIILFTLLLVVFGLLMVTSASSELGQKKFNDSYFYLKHQLIYGLSIGLIGFLTASKIYYKYLQKIATFLLLLTIVGLILVFTPLGASAGGASRWLEIGGFVFQPSEILKITFIVYIAAWLSGKEERRTSFWGGFVPFLVISGLISALLIFQPSTSVVVILMASALAVYFASGAKISYILGIIVLGILALAVISYFSPYRWQRLTGFLNPEENIQNSAFHINQALIAIGSGGLTGVGYGQSTTKILYLPEPIGDSIFAVVGEEFGFIGSLFLISAFLFLIMRGFLLSRKIGDRFGRLLLIGFSALIGVQAFVNIGAISGLIPLTGTPLPFISYGGTALAVFMTISGIMVNISKHT
jgi:cell division protein FtsW